MRILMMLSTAVLSGIVAAAPRPKILKLPTDSIPQAPAHAQFLPQSWGPIHSGPPTYPPQALRSGKSGFTMAWIRFGNDGCPQRIELKQAQPGRTFIKASMPLYASMRIVVPEGESGPFWHLIWTNYIIDNGSGHQPKWAAKLDSMRPEPFDRELKDRLRREHRPLLKQACPPIEVLDPIEQ